MRFSGRLIGDHYNDDHDNILKMLTNVCILYVMMGIFYIYNVDLIMEIMHIFRFLI